MQARLTHDKAVDLFSGMKPKCRPKVRQIGRAGRTADRVPEYIAKSNGATPQTPQSRRASDA